MINKTLFLIVVIVSGTSCTNRVYFGTSTNLGIDIAVDTSKAGIGYKNSQLAFIPATNNEDGLSVLGQTDVDISISDIVIKEIFATGKAAECAANALDNTTINKIKAGNDGSNKVKHDSLIFGSFNSISIVDLNFGTTNPFVGASFGYKRATATVIPVNEDEVLRSVYANSYVNSTSDKGDSTSRTQTDGIRFKQDFATGKAALYMSSKNAKKLTAGSMLTGCVPVP